MAQIQKGTTFATGDQVTAINLNAHVDSAVLLPGAISDQVSDTAAPTDAILINKAGSLKKTTISSALDAVGALRADGTIPLTTGAQLVLGSTQQVSALQAISKGHVDANFLAVTGGTVSGNVTLTTAAVITLSKDPVSALQAVTKQYSDNRPGLAKAWVNFDGTTSATWAGGTSTVTRASGSTTATISTASNHNLITGNTVNVLTGVAVGAYVITRINDTSFTIQTIATTAIFAVSITFQGCTINSSYNVSSITKYGAGVYSVNFATALGDINYTATLSAQPSSSGNPSVAVPFCGLLAVLVTPTTTSMWLRVTNYNFSAEVDSALVCVQIFGN
jgi:hypothetical protein